MSGGEFKTGGGMAFLSGLVEKEGKDRLVGRNLGDYEIVRLIGEGGMGRVYLAERRDGSFNRQVAIKVASASALSRTLRERFRTEQGVLASLNHPSIAQLYDASVTDEGWPFFVMELVNGGPITEYCAGIELSTRDKIELLIDVVDAVAFAHARLIVHRDIKPSNVLVNADGRPKLLDFGIAKLLESDAVDLTQATPLTPRYASPEQLLHEPITTAVDTYQLGLLIYEVLVGKPLQGPLTLSEAIDRARHERTLQLSGTARGSLPREIVRVVEHCLRPEAGDRYRDAGALRDDLQAFLDGYPVKAVGQSVVYRATKSLRRNWLAFSLTALIILGTSAALIESTIQRNTLQTTRDTLQRVTEFQQDMLLSIDAEEMGRALSEDLRNEILASAGPVDRTDRVRVAKALDQVNFTDVSRQSIDRNILAGAVSAIDDSFSDDKVVASALRDVVSDVYEAIGMYHLSVPLRERVVADRTLALGPTHASTLKAHESLGSVLFDTGQYAAAASAFEHAYSIRRKTQGPDHKDTVAALGDYGNLLIDLNRNEQAERLLTEALERSRRVFGERHWSTGRVLSNLGYLYFIQGRYEQVLPLWEEALGIDTENYGRDHPDTLDSANNLAAVYEEIGRLGEAERIYRETVAILGGLLGDSHPSTLTTMNNLAINLRGQERFAEASQMTKHVAEGHAVALGEDHPNSIRTLSNHAATLNDLERPAEAEMILVDLLERARSTLPADHEIIGVLLGRYGRCLRLQGRYQESEYAFLEARRIIIDVVGTTGKRKNTLLRQIAGLYDDWGHPARSRATLAELDPAG